LTLIVIRPYYKNAANDGTPESHARSDGKINRFSSLKDGCQDVKWGLCKQRPFLGNTRWTRSRGNEYACNNRITVENGVRHAVGAETFQPRHLEQRVQLSVDRNFCTGGCEERT
jgi:hypothetical protein